MGARPSETPEDTNGKFDKSSPEATPEPAPKDIDSEIAGILDQIPKQNLKKARDNVSNRSNLDFVAADAQQDIRLKKLAYQWVSSLVTLQLIASNSLIFMYLTLAGIGAIELSSTAIQWWIIGSVVQVIGLALVVVKYLFGGRTNGNKD